MTKIIKQWMTDNFLSLNEDKTEILLIGSQNSHKKLSIPSIEIGSGLVNLVPSAKNIGFTFDCFMNSNKHVNLIVRSAWNQIRSIGRIRKYLDVKSCE